MNADAFRQLYDYHFSENRKIWDTCVMPLSQEQFIQDASYSHGSVRNQIAHMMNADDMWFCELRGVANPNLLDTEVNDRQLIREHWDAVERTMQGYLSSLRDEMLFQKPITVPEEDKILFTWQVLLHVANHGTDHRAQVLRLLNDLGVKTESQDFIFYVFEHQGKSS